MVLPIYIYMFPPTAMPRLPLSATPFAACAASRFRDGHLPHRRRWDSATCGSWKDEGLAKNNAGFNWILYRIYIWDLCCFNIFNGIYAVLIGWNIAFNENGNDDFYGNIMFYHPDMGFSWTLINVFRIYRFNHEEYRYNNWYNNFSWFAIKGKWTGNGLGVGPHAGFRP